MSLLYADTSALARAYFVDEPDHDALRLLVLEGTEPVVTSELTRVELASAVTAATCGAYPRASADPGPVRCRLRRRGAADTVAPGPGTHAAVRVRASSTARGEGSNPEYHFTPFGVAEVKAESKTEQLKERRQAG